MAEVGSAFVSILPSARGFGRSLDSAITPGINSSGKKAGKSFGSVFGAAVKGTLAGLGIAKIGSEAVQFLGDSLAEGREAEKVGKRTASVIKSMGLESKVTTQRISDLSTSISNKTGIDDEQIQAGANMLLTFKDLASSAGDVGGNFDKATGLVADLSAAMGTSGKSAAIQLGKALNDPVKGMTGLSRAGIQFTDEQKDQIKKLVSNGDTMKAQGIILGEVSKQFGGAAEAMATPSDKARVAADNLKEQIGTALIPVVDDLANFATNKLIPAISEFVSGMQDGTGAGGQFADAAKKIWGALKDVWGILKPVFTFIIDNKEAVATFAGVLLTVAAAVKVWRAAQVLLNFALAANPFGLVVLALAALAGGLVYAYKKSETFRNIVKKSFEIVGNVGRWLWNNALQPAFKFIVSGLAAIIEGAADMLDALSHVPGFDWAKGAADKMHGAADAAKGLADRIVDIPNTVPITVTVNTSAINKAEAQIDRLGGSRSRTIAGRTISSRKYGRVIGDAFADGVEMSFRKKLPKSEEALNKTLDRMVDKLKSLKDTAKSLAESVASAFTQDAFGGGLADFIKVTTGNIASLTAMKAALAQIKSFGASDSFIKALFSSGNTALISQLAAGGAGAVANAQSLFAQQNSLGAELGSSVSQTVLGDEIRGVRKEIRELRKDLKKAGRDNAREFARVLNGTAAAAKRSSNERLVVA